MERISRSLYAVSHSFIELLSSQLLNDSKNKSHLEELMVQFKKAVEDHKEGHDLSIYGVCLMQIRSTSTHVQIIGPNSPPSSDPKTRGEKERKKTVFQEAKGNQRLKMRAEMFGNEEERRRRVLAYL